METSEDEPTFTPVQSSNIAGVAYQTATQTLFVRFTNGSLYEYSDVPASVAEGLLSAPSAGRYFHQAIKNSYDYTRKG